MIASMRKLFGYIILIVFMGILINQELKASEGTSGNTGENTEETKHIEFLGKQIKALCGNVTDGLLTIQLQIAANASLFLILYTVLNRALIIESSKNVFSKSDTFYQKEWEAQRKSVYQEIGDAVSMSKKAIQNGLGAYLNVLTNRVKKKLDTLVRKRSAKAKVVDLWNSLYLFSNKKNDTALQNNCNLLEIDMILNFFNNQPDNFYKIGLYKVIENVQVYDLKKLTKYSLSEQVARTNQGDDDSKDAEQYNSMLEQIQYPGLEFNKNFIKNYDNYLNLKLPVYPYECLCYLAHANEIIDTAEQAISTTSLEKLRTTAGVQEKNETIQKAYAQAEGYLNKAQEKVSAIMNLIDTDIVPIIKKSFPLISLEKSSFRIPLGAKTQAALGLGIAASGGAYLATKHPKQAQAVAKVAERAVGYGAQLAKKATAAAIKQLPRAPASPF